MNSLATIFYGLIANLKTETESHLIATQNNAKSTKFVDARKENTQQNSVYRFCGHKDEKIKHIINEWSELVKRDLMTGHELVGKVIHWTFCKMFEFNETNK